MYGLGMTKNLRHHIYEGDHNCAECTTPLSPIDVGYLEEFLDGEEVYSKGFHYRCKVSADTALDTPTLCGTI